MLSLLDRSAAFDTVDHTLLLTCRKSAGVIGVLHMWFESYLSSIILRQGVQYGSVFGPALT